MKKTKGIEYAKYHKGDKDEPGHYHIFCQLYEINYYLIIGQKEKTQNWFDYVQDSCFDSEGVVFEVNGKVHIWLRSKNELDTFSHELVHAISKTMDLKGITYDTENDEPYAYLMSWLFRSFYFAIK